MGEVGWTGSLRRRARAHLADPLFRNGYALMVNTGATGALGAAYWLVAARYYADADVGRGSATVSAMMLLSGVAALSLTGMLTRFVPRAGRWTAALVRRTYLVSALASMAATGAFLAGLGHWGGSYAHLGGWLAAGWFAASVVAWGIFTLQDGVLTGLRAAVWVPVKNTYFGIAKIALLVALVAAAPHDGVFLSWMIPVAVALVPINVLISARLVPRHVARTPRYGAEYPSARRVGRFLAGDSVGALCVLATLHLVPVAVAARVEPSTFAYFYIAWTIGGIIDLLAVNMAMSLTVEGSHDAGRLAAATRAALRRTLRILVPISVAVIVLAPYGLAVLGPGYAAEGTRLLQLLALAALPKVLIELHLGVLRAHSRTGTVAFVQVVRGGLIVASALVLTSVTGIAGAGFGVLISQSIVAAMVLPGLRRALAKPPAPRPPAAAAAPK